MSTPPMDFGNSAQPLEYAMPVPAGGRPGILTAVGVISIVIGGFSVLGSLAGIFSGIMYMRMSNMTFPATVTPPATMPASAIFVVPTTQPSTRPAIPGTGSWTQISATSSINYAPAGGNNGAVAGPTVGGNGVFTFNVSSEASELSITEASLSLCAAVLLIVAGILMLLDSPRAWRLHRIYLMLKFPLILIGAFATWWTFTSLMSGSSAIAGTPGAAGFANSAGIIQAVFSGGFSMIYPVALVIVLSTRTSKDYRNRLVAGVI